MSLKADVELLAEQGPLIQEGLCWQTVPKCARLIWAIEELIRDVERQDGAAAARSLARIRDILES